TKVVLKNASVITIPRYLFNLISLNVLAFKLIDLNQKLMHGEPDKPSIHQLGCDSSEYCSNII
ncbi:MAG: hypothetical protein WB474_00565, partial [Nitrososphaeraceae archaeon]